MNQRTMWSQLIAVACLVGPIIPRAYGQTPKTMDPRCERVLPVATANQLTGRTDLIVMGRRALPAAGGTCNYAAGGKKMVFLVTILDEKSHAVEHFTRYKGQPEYRENQRDVAGLGDAAFTGGAYEHEVVVRKGGQVVMVASMVAVDRTTHATHGVVTRDQLIAVAREVVGKL